MIPGKIGFLSFLSTPAMPWDWKGGKSDSGVYDNVLPDADAHK